jgi:hypothetical protein
LKAFEEGVAILALSEVGRTVEIKRGKLVMTHFVKIAAVLITSLFGVISVTNAAPPERVWVVYKEGGKGAVARVLRSANAEIHYEMDSLNAYVASMPSAAARGLSRNPHIDYIEADVKRYPFGETTPYGITAVQALEVSDAQAGNRMICIIDSGLDQAHPEFTSQFNISGTSDPGTGDWFTDRTHTVRMWLALSLHWQMVRVSLGFSRTGTSGYTLSKCLVHLAGLIAQVSLLHWMRVKLRDQMLSA